MKQPSALERITTKRAVEGEGYETFVRNRWSDIAHPVCYTVRRNGMDTIAEIKGNAMNTRGENEN
jgi:hypothetical protein